jgi:hypothetical protein
VPFGILLVRQEEDGRWVILAGAPDVKIDNKHMDRRPHMHVGSWDAEDRQALRQDLTATEAASAIRHQLGTIGYLDLDALKEELS